MIPEGAVRSALRWTSVFWVPLDAAATVAAVEAAGPSEVAMVLISNPYLAAAFWFLIPLGWLSLLSLYRLRKRRAGLLDIDLIWLTSALIMLSLSVVAEAAASVHHPNPLIYVTSTTIPESLGVVAFFTMVVRVFEVTGLAPRPDLRRPLRLPGIVALAASAPAAVGLATAVWSGRMPLWDGIAFGATAAWLAYLLVWAYSVPDKAQEAAGTPWLLAVAALSLQLSNFYAWFLSAAAPSPLSFLLGVLSDSMDLLSWVLIPLSVFSLVGFRIEAPGEKGVVEVVEIPTTGPWPRGLWEKVTAASGGGRIVVVGKRWCSWMDRVRALRRGVVVYLSTTVTSPREISDGEFECPPEPEALIGLISALAQGERAAVVLDDLSDITLLCGLDKMRSCWVAMRELVDEGVSFFLLLRRGSLSPAEQEEILEIFGRASSGESSGSPVSTLGRSASEDRPS